MAIDASNTNTNQTAPVSSAPLAGGGGSAPSQPQQAQMPQQAPTQSQTPATIQSGSRPSGSTGRQPASSGTFTNIRNYMQRNQGAGAQVAGAVTQNVQNTANAVNQKREELNQQFRRAAESQGVQNIEGAVQDVRNTATAAATMQAQNAPGQPAQTPAPGSFQVQQRTSQQFQAPAPEAVSNDDRIRDVLNMQYQGPASIRDIGGFSGLLERARELDQKRQNVVSSDRTATLRDTFAGQGNDYTAGLRRLDDLFLGGNIQQVQQNLQNIDRGQDVIDRGVRESGQIAGERARLIDTTRGQAREELLNIARGRQAEIDQALSREVENFNALPEYMKQRFRDALSSGDPSKVRLTQDEASLLGVQAGSGLFNLVKDQAGINNLIQGQTANQARLIQRDEFDQLARLQALTNLAQGGLGFENRFVDRDLAGSQTVLDAIDRGRVGRVLGQAADQTISEMRNLPVWEIYDRIGNPTNILGDGSGESPRTDFLNHLRQLGINESQIRTNTGQDFDINRRLQDSRNLVNRIGQASSLASAGVDVRNIGEAANDFGLSGYSQDELDLAQRLGDFNNAKRLGRIAPSLNINSDFERQYAEAANFARAMQVEAPITQDRIENWGLNNRIKEDLSNAGQERFASLRDRLRLNRA